MPSTAPRPTVHLALAAVALTLLTTLAGCTDLFGPQRQMAVTDLKVGDDQWNRDGRFRAKSLDGGAVTIDAHADDGRDLHAAGQGEASLEIPDGRWSISYGVDGKTFATLSPVRIDGTPPGIHGLVLEATAKVGDTVQIGAGAVVDAGAKVRVADVATNATLGTALPVTVGPLEDGIHRYRVYATDQAGNVASASVEVRVGTAADLPAGAFTFGVVGRYTNQVRLWDISDPSRYLSRAAAQKAAPGYLGAGLGVDPTNTTVKSVVAQVVTSDMNTEQAAEALFVWMADHVKYDFSRLDSKTLMNPDQVLNDREDRFDHDSDGNGVVDNGNGNGVKGGICRDLAATYVSLLRGAGVPARLVSGYLGGQVNGFHAWVQFYGGPVGGQEPWIVVDVSPLTGKFNPSILVQAFAIQPTDYLALRTVAPEHETKGWSTALDVQYEWPQTAAKPEVDFAKKVTAANEEKGFLCFSTTTHARKLVTAPDQCGAGYGYYANMTLRSERTIDYGIHVKSAPRGTTINAEVAYPFLDAVRPNGVSYRFYGPDAVLHPEDGKATAKFDL